MTTRINPFTELERFFSQLSEQFDDTSRELGTAEPFSRLSLGVSRMAVDIVEHDETFVVTADLPGFDSDEVDVQVTDHTLRIDADHEETTEAESEGRYLRRERRRESMRRSVRLPSDVDADGVTATMNNGALTVTLPKETAEDAHEVDIEVE